MIDTGVVLALRIVLKREKSGSGSEMTEEGSIYCSGGREEGIRIHEFFVLDVLVICTMARFIISA